MNERERSRTWSLRIRHIHSHELVIRRLVRRFFARQQDKIIHDLTNAFKSAKGDLLVRGVRFDRDYWTQNFAETVGNQIRATVEEMGRVYAGEQFDIHNPSVISSLEHFIKFTGEEINKTTEKKLVDTLSEGMQNGESIRQLVKRVNDVYDSAIGKRAVGIARTTAFAASNFGVQKGMEQGGWERKMWLTSRDNRVRPSHQIDGQVVPVDKPFILADGREMMYPMDYNERCTHIATHEPVTVDQYSNIVQTGGQWEWVNNQDTLKEKLGRLGIGSNGIFTEGKNDAIIKRLNLVGEDIVRIRRYSKKLENLINTDPIRYFELNGSKLYIDEGQTVGIYQPQYDKILIGKGRGSKPEVDKLKFGGRIWNVGDASFKSVFRHELGHHIYKVLDKRSEFARFFREHGKEYFKKYVSGYAGSDGGNEAFSETFSVFLHPEYGKSKKLPRELDKLMRGILKEND